MPPAEIQPIMVIIAGPNGSGKTRLAPFFLKQKRIKNYFNPDEIARGLSPLDPENEAVEAGKIVIRKIRETIQKKESFAIETTLSGGAYPKNYAEQAKAAGYKILMIYLYTEDVRINIKRISNRKKEGGHSVPSEAVRRRYDRSLANLFKIFPFICDRIELYNSYTMPPQFVATGGMLGLSPIWSFRTDQAELWGRLMKKMEKSDA